MKKICLLIALFAFISVKAQDKKIKPSDELRIEGKIKHKKTLSLVDLSALPETHINDQIIFNNKGEAKDTLKNLKGVLLKTILEQIEFVYDNPKALNEFYFVFVATDGYKVVFSWNEIFNTETGNYFYLITSIEAKTFSEINDRIMFISTKDFKNGRRYIKGLKKIVVKQVD